MRALLLLVALAACKGKTAAPAVSPDAREVVIAIPAADAGVPSPLLALLDAFEQERDATRRAQLALEIAREDAIAVGVHDRVVTLVRTYVALPHGDHTASSLMASLIHHVGPPPPAVAELVLELARDGGRHTSFVALHVLPRLRDRLPDVCARLAELAATPALPRAVAVVALTGDACVAHLDPVVDAMRRAMEAEAYDVEHYLATRELLAQTPLTPAQLDRLAAGARIARKRANRHLLDLARDLERRLDRL